ncbi:MAG: beta-lactamase family protein [Bacteroidetes bacterium]|nr:beta-lactamase family protein [Bacteroidota bacterium]
MKNNIKIFILSIFILNINLFAQFTKVDSVKVLMQQFIGNDDNGLLFGFYNIDFDSLSIITVGKINKGDDLKLACPTTKSCLSYIFLKEKINLDTAINNWYPKEIGYAKSDSITLKMLLYNTSGIQEYIKFIKIDPDEIITPEETIKLSYQNQKLDFAPGTQYGYSNTNFNILGKILESVKRENINEIINEYFNQNFPSLRMDNGKGKYPTGYIKPWTFHWSATGFAGGLIGTAEDAIKVFAFISQQPEYEQMTDWIEDKNKSNHLVGMGIFALKDFGEFGTVIMYDGDMMANQMLLMKIGNTVYYFHTTYPAGLENLINFAKNVITLIN